jgi:hypothetical protein
MVQRQHKGPSSNEYVSVLTATARTLFDSSVLTASEISQTWPEKMGGSPLSNESAWSIQIELTWFFIAAICREVFNMGRMEPLRHTIQDDLLSAVISQMLDRMFDRSQETLLKREEQTNRLLEWYNESEMEYGSTVSVTPSQPHIAFEDNLAGKWAIRIAKAMDQQENVALMVDLSATAIRAYVAANIPKCTLDLVSALRTNP